MRSPTSTYRVQLSPAFTFQDLQEILDYLEQLGISTIYSAPFFKARKGSSHGYDVTDPFSLNKEIGRLETFRKITEQLKQKNMGWLQDIVPNHMAFDPSNQWLSDIFELGPDSEYFNYFDIDWESKDQKVLAPFLGKPLPEVLEDKDLGLVFSKKGFTLNYFDHAYPVSARSYEKILSSETALEWQKKFRNFSAQENDWTDLKHQFLTDTEADDKLKTSVEDLVAEINTSEEKIKEVLDLQYFIPTYWKITEEEINYRRFFTINDLICLRMEDKKVFDSYHSFIKQLCDSGFINGLRIDHIDGLFDPLKYLENLRTLVGNDFYIIIEKILEWDEKLPKHWPVEGTSGYGFLAEVNQLFTDNKKGKIFTDAYHKINPLNEDYEDLVYHQKLFILKERMGGEYNNLWKLLKNLGLLTEENLTADGKNALGAFLAAFPVYRIYPEEFPLKMKQKQIIETAFLRAQLHVPNLEKELNLLKDVFLGVATGDKDKMLYFLQRCQQFTGPLAAKGGEDTSFYIFNKLISHNEVGDSPQNFGLEIKGFHQRMEQRENDFPLSINATATHDTKRGEDARMRINVLSELGAKWFEKVEEWRGIARSFRNGEVPDANEEYFIFQMLVGAFPFDLEPGEKFLERSTAYLQKVLREAKAHSSWAMPDVNYEESVYQYLETLLKDEDFKASFLPFQEKLMPYGVLKSLSQAVIKIIAPGIPDVYQGTELWDLSYVDPDNRRPVDYSLRKKFLSEIQDVHGEGFEEVLEKMKNDYPSGKIKLFCIHKALKLRKEYQEIFEEGDYIPLELSERFSDEVIGFARRKGEKWVVLIAPVLVTELFDEKLELKKEFSEEVLVKLPEEVQGNLQHLFTSQEFKSSQFTAGELLGKFPVTIMTNF